MQRAGAMLRAYAEFADPHVLQAVERYIFDQPRVVRLVRFVRDHLRAARGKEQRKDAVERADVVNDKPIQREIVPKHFLPRLS